MEVGIVKLPKLPPGLEHLNEVESTLEISRCHQGGRGVQMRVVNFKLLDIPDHQDYYQGSLRTVPR